MKPTIGRIIHVFNRPSHNGSPEAGIVTYVHNDEGMVNATVFNVFGTACSQTSIQHRDQATEDGLFWDWPARD